MQMSSIDQTTHGVWCAILQHITWFLVGLYVQYQSTQAVKPKTHKQTIQKIKQTRTTKFNKHIIQHYYRQVQVLQVQDATTCHNNKTMQSSITDMYYAAVHAVHYI